MKKLFKKIIDKKDQETTLFQKENIKALQDPLLAKKGLIVKVPERNGLLVTATSDTLKMFSNIDDKNFSLIEKIADQKGLKFYAAFNESGNFLGFINAEADLAKSYDDLVFQFSTNKKPNITFDNIKSLIVWAAGHKILNEQNTVKNAIIQFINDEGLDTAVLNERQQLLQQVLNELKTNKEFRTNIFILKLETEAKPKTQDTETKEILTTAKKSKDSNEVDVQSVKIELFEWNQLKKIKNSGIYVFLNEEYSDFSDSYAIDTMRAKEVHGKQYDLPASIMRLVAKYPDKILYVVQGETLPESNKIVPNSKNKYVIELDDGKLTKTRCLVKINQLIQAKIDKFRSMGYWDQELVVEKSEQLADQGENGRESKNINTQDELKRIIKNFNEHINMLSREIEEYQDVEKKLKSILGIVMACSDLKQSISAYSEFPHINNKIDSLINTITEKLKKKYGLLFVEKDNKIIYFHSIIDRYRNEKNF